MSPYNTRRSAFAPLRGAHAESCAPDSGHTVYKLLRLQMRLHALYRIGLTGNLRGRVHPRKYNYTSVQIAINRAVNIGECMHVYRP